MNVLPDVCLFPQEEECASSSWGDSKMYTCSSIANSHRMQTEINESGTIAKIRIYVENDSQTLKSFRIISSEMKISLLVLSWWCFSCQHILRIDIQYTDQLFWKNNTLGTVDMILINKLQFLIFFHFSDLWNLVKWMDSVVQCYSINMKVIWLYMVSAPLPLQWWGGGGDLIWKFAKILWCSWKEMGE